MAQRIWPAETGDLNRLVEIYNHYITETHTTFDTEPFAVGERTQFSEVDRFDCSSHGVGHKFGRLWDVSWYEKELSNE